MLKNDVAMENFHLYFDMLNYLLKFAVINY